MDDTNFYRREACGKKDEGINVQKVIFPYDELM